MTVAALDLSAFSLGASLIGRNRYLLECGWCRADADVETDGRCANCGGPRKPV